MSVIITNSNDLHLDYDVLKAYVYDVYSIEQAIALTRKLINKFKSDKSQLENEENQEVSKLQTDYNNQISIIKNSYSKTEYIKWKNMKKSILIDTIFNVFILLSICSLLVLFFDDYKLWLPLLFIVLCLACKGISLIEKKSRYSKQQIKAENINLKKKNEINQALLGIRARNESEINAIKNTYSEQIIKIDIILDSLYRQLRDFEECKTKLYQALSIIPFNHQNLPSAAYIHQYLETSRETDINYIFTQLNLEKIKQSLSRIIENEQRIIVNQEKTLAQLEHMSSQLSRINSSIVSFSNSYSHNSEAIIHSLDRVTDAETKILTNQAKQIELYNSALKNANNNNNKQEIEAYANLIAQNTRKILAYKEAEFYGFDMIEPGRGFIQ